MVSQTQRVKEENKQLRKELLGLIRKTRALHEKRQELEGQHKSLKHDLQYGKDLCRIQGSPDKLGNSTPRKSSRSVDGRSVVKFRQTLEFHIKLFLPL